MIVKLNCFPVVIFIGLYLPHDLNPIILCNKKVTLNILFAAVNGTLQAFAGDPQWRLEGQLG